LWVKFRFSIADEKQQKLFEVWNLDLAEWWCEWLRLTTKKQQNDDEPIRIIVPEFHLHVRDVCYRPRTSLGLVIVPVT
jgi:hypothetical protein